MFPGLQILQYNKLAEERRPKTFLFSINALTSFMHSNALYTRSDIIQDEATL